MEDSEKCINCNSTLSGNYCSSCGQKGIIKRLSIKTFFEDYLSRLFGMDTNFLRTLRDLSIRPGQVGRSFIRGNRVKYIGPVGYFFLITTFLILTYQFLGIEINEFLTQTSKDIVGQSETNVQSEEIQIRAIGLISNNLKLLGFLAIPFYSLWGIVFFRNAKLNFFEHSVNILYVQGHLVFAKIIALFIFKLSGIIINPYLQFIDLPFFVWSCFGFYEVRGFKNLMKAVMLYIISFISFIIVVVVITLLYAFWGT